MRIYAMIDPDVDRCVPVGYLYCYEKAEAYIIELRDGLNEWEAPLLFQKCVREGRYTIPKELSLLWVRERVVPNTRQNIGTILKEAGLKEYRERLLLGMTKGKCSQDNCYLKEVSYAAIPELIKKRSLKNVKECYPVPGGCVVCSFRDGTICKVSVKKIAGRLQGLEYVLKKDSLVHSVKVGIGGYGIEFENGFEIPLEFLHMKEYHEELNAEDTEDYLHNNVMNTTEACNYLNCSRQNIAYLVETGKLTPVIRGKKENYFTRGSIERVATE